MNFKKFLAFLTVYAVVIISVPFIFNNAWLKDFPQMKTYEGELKFSGERAYEDVKYIGINFPQREVGSENAESSANWVFHEFEQRGLETYKENFACRSIDKLIKAAIGETTNEGLGFDSISMDGLFSQVEGINVIGVSKGKSDQTIIIGAHRDTLGTLEGAQDNASGTASMLELARVLTNEEHYYTYMFISFDGEEIGLKGSEAFARKNSLKKVKLALILDCVGYKDADTVGLYQFASAKGASPLWTTVLANNIITNNGRKTYYIDNEGGFGGNGIGIFPSLMSKMVSLKVSGDVNTDSGPFVDRNIPAVGFIAANSERKVDPEEVYHTPEDTISKVSKETLDFIGKISEQYIKSIELNDFPLELASSTYLVKENKYIGVWSIIIFSVLVLLAVIMLWLISCTEVFIKRDIFLNYVKKELPWIISILVLSLFCGLVWQLLRFDFASDFNLALMLLLWLGVSFLGLVTIITVRTIMIRDKRDNYHEITRYQRILLNSLYFLVFILTTLFYNVFVAIILVGTSILVMGRVGYKNVASRVVWGFVLFVWFVFQTVSLFICIAPYLLDFLQIKASVLLILYSLLVNFTFVYVLSAPFMPKKE